MATEEEIKRIIQDIQRRRELWQLSPRQKNLRALMSLGIDEDLAFDIIAQHLTWKDYVEGPEADNHVPPIPGDIWVFGMIIEDRMCYLKFQDREDKVVVWISLHPAQHELYFPYQ